MRLAFLLSALLAAELTLPQLIHQINALSAQRRFDDAERIARDAVRRFPNARDAQIALARVLLWQGRYHDAKRAFAVLLARNPNDADARLGLAQAEYWSGDFRRAARDFEGVLKQRPHDELALRSIGEIRSTARPGYVLRAGAMTDDQPLRTAVAEVTAYAFSDPLTKFDVTVSGIRFDSRLADRDARSVRVATEVGLPSMAASASTAGSWCRFADSESRFLPSVSLCHGPVAIGFDRRPLFGSQFAIRTHPTADALSIRFARSSYAITTERLRYFDHNHGVDVSGYLLTPAVRNFSGGIALAYRDTGESRFGNGVHSPYWTPAANREARLVASFSTSRFGAHLDGGVGRDRVAGSFHPWRAMAHATIPLRTGAALSIEAEHSVTAFYRSDAIRASVAGRF